jgi:hypothetical protein
MGICNLEQAEALFGVMAPQRMMHCLHQDVPYAGDGHDQETYDSHFSHEFFPECIFMGKVKQEMVNEETL